MMNRLLIKISGIIRFYSDGFSSLSWWGRRAWLIILIKLFIIFFIFRIFFFQDFLGRKYDNDEKKSEYVRDQLINLK